MKEMSFSKIVGVFVLLLASWSPLAVAFAETTLKIGMLSLRPEPPPVLSNLDPIPPDLVIAGAQLGVEENKTTGKFLGVNFELKVFSTDDITTALDIAKEAFQYSRFIVVDAPADLLIKIADLPEATKQLLINASSPDVHLRQENCRYNLLHTIPSNAMRADALMQFAAFRKWRDLALISGLHDKDIAFAEALKKSARKFGLKIVEEKIWAFDADMRRNASQEVPLFTQDLGEYDLLVVADELNDFGRYISYNTWLPRPVSGSEGLSPVAWSSVVEQWGAAQLQSRFLETAGREMFPEDYAAWAAVRTLGEAVIRTKKTDLEGVRSYIMSDQFKLAGFKGKSLNFRHWNGQMRQPMILATKRAVVAQTPLQGFLHQSDELDTLGIDEPESRCSTF
jgi:ABC transporter substrate binding protein (PQQ-dependent alcohol dehydrogenase system)